MVEDNLGRGGLINIFVWGLYSVGVGLSIGVGWVSGLECRIISNGRNWLVGFSRKDGSYRMKGYKVLWG